MILDDVEGGHAESAGRCSDERLKGGRRGHRQIERLLRVLAAGDHVGQAPGAGRGEQRVAAQLGGGHGAIGGCPGQERLAHPARPDRPRLGQLAQRAPDILGGQVSQRGRSRSASSPAGAGPQVTGQFCLPARPALRSPVVHSLGHRVGIRGPQASVRFGLELLELLPDLGLGPAGDLAPDPRTARTPAERDGTDPGTVRRIAVDRTFAVTAAASDLWSYNTAIAWLRLSALLVRSQLRRRDTSCFRRRAR